MPRTTPQPSIPLGSLTQPGHGNLRICAACGSDRVTELSMTLTDGTPVEFVSCHACEHRTWIAAPSADQDVPVVLTSDQVLDRTRKLR
jgi:hypothetical protein